MDPTTGRLYMIGGGGDQTWTSTDGRVWQQSSSTAQFPGVNYFPCAVDSNSNVYLFGGYNSNYGTVSGTTWLSSNYGAAWAAVSTNPLMNYEARGSHAAAQYFSSFYSTDLLYVTAGNTCPYGCSNNVNQNMVSCSPLSCPALPSSAQPAR